jgi:hypothetical protein
VGVRGFGGALCSDGFTDLLDRSMRVGDGLSNRGFDGVTGSLQALGDVLLRGLDMLDGIHEMLLDRFVLCAK